MFQPIETDAKVKLGEMRLQFRGRSCLVEYRSEKRFQKAGAAVEEVAVALGVADFNS